MRRFVAIRKSRPATLAAVLFVLGGLAAPALAYLTVSLTSGSNGAATSGTLSAPTISAPSSTSGTITLTWSSASKLAGSSNSAITYTVERKAGSGGTYAAIGSGSCSGSLAYTTTSCTDTVPSSGSYYYHVIAHFNSWIATTGDLGPNADSTAPSVPTLGALASPVATTTANGASLTTLTASNVSDNTGGTGVQNVSYFYCAGTCTTTPDSAPTAWSKIGTSSTSTGSYPVSWSSPALADGTYTVIAQTLDNAGNDSFSATKTTVVHNTAPTLLSINRAGTNSTTNAGPLTWTVTFSEAVSGVTASNFSTTKSSGITGTIGSPTITGSGTTYTVSVTTTGMTGANTNNTITLNMVSGTAVADAAGNNLSGTNIPFAGQAYTYDTTAPTVVSVNTAGTSSTTNSGPLTWTVTFSEAVTGVTGSNFSTTKGTGITGSLGTPSVTGSGATYTVSVPTTGVTGGNTNNSITLNVANATGITDSAGNSLSAAGFPFAGQAYTYDTTAPAGLTIASCSFSNGSHLACSGQAGNATGDGPSISVQVYLASNNSVAATLSGARSGTTWSASNTGLGPGTYYAIATQTDAAGNSSTAQSANFSR